MIFLPATAVARTRAATTNTGDGGAIGESNDLGGGISSGESNLRTAFKASDYTFFSINYQSMCVASSGFSTNAGKKISRLLNHLKIILLLSWAQNLLAS